MSDYIFGPHAVEAALRAGTRKVHEVYVNEKHFHKYEDLFDEFSIRPIPVSMAELNRDFAGKVHQGIVAKVGPLQQVTLDDILPSAKLILMLDQVTDPHNLGACLRSADAFGVDAILIPEHKSARLTDVATKAAAGAAETVPLIPVVNLSQTLDKMKDAGFWSVGLDGYATETLAEVDLKGKMVIVMGSEGQGLRELVKKNCDFTAKIPMLGTVESLNVSVSTGVALYEALRQRQK